MKSVIIAEKPSVAADIAMALGGFRKIQSWYESDNAIVTNGLGHLVECFSPEMELPSANKLDGLPVLGEQFKLRPKKNASSQLSVIKKLISRDDVSQIVNACDAGREGELIFRLIYAACGARKPIRRMWYTSMTKDALRDAWKDIEDGSRYNALYEAALCRNESDYLVGLNASKGISDCLSILARKWTFMRAGRVQTPVLALIVDRENEIKNFTPKSFKEIVGCFKTSEGEYEATLHFKSDQDENLATRILDEAVLKTMLQKVQSGRVESASDVVKTVTSRPPKLFSLSELQKAASSKYRFTAQKTLDITQKLYESYKLVTYPRTSSDALPEDYVNTVNVILNETFVDSVYEKYTTNAKNSGKLISSNKNIFDNERISDHFAIIPAVGSRADISKLSEDESKIYDLIVRRFFAAFYPDAIFDETVRTTVLSGYSFIVKGKVLKQIGWLGLADARKKDDVLCPLDSSSLPDVANISVKTGQTTPPKRYDDGTLLTAMINAGRLVDDKDLSQAMKLNGLGTEATRASIIEGLLVSKTGSGKPVDPYLLRDKTGHFIPTPLAFQLIEFCRSSGLEMLTSPLLTGEWEHRLAQVETGKIRRSEFMSGIREQVVNMIDLLKGKVAGVNAQEALIFTKADCPKCHGKLNDFVDHIGCHAKCGFKIYKSMFGRSFTDDEISDVIKNGESPVFNNFKSFKKGTVYSASIVLDSNYSAKLQLPENEGKGKEQTNELTSFKCPKCQKALSKSSGSYPVLSCQQCNFTLSMIIAKRKMSQDELSTLLDSGYLNSRKGFVSKLGKDFSAALSLDKQTGKVTFSFDD